MNTINAKIQMRTDELSDWTSVNPVLNLGEIAIVLFEDGTENIKIGNGISSFSELNYLYQTRVKTDVVTAKEVTAKSISQGYNVKSTPTSLATGIFTEADGNFDVVHGIEAKAKEGDDYAFVFNGSEYGNIAERYESHGKGTFNINPLSGIAGTYIGDQSLSAILSTYLLSSELSSYYTKAQIEVIYNNLTGKIELSTSSLRDQLSSVSSDLKAQDAAIVQKLNVAREQLSSSIEFLSGTVSLDVKNLADNYWKKSETSSAAEISEEFKNYQLSGNYLSSTDISVEYLSSDNTVTLSVQNTVQKAKLPQLSRVIMNTWTD